MLLKKYDEHDSVHDKQMFLKRVLFWYDMLCYGMVWNVWCAMRFQCYAMRFLCYGLCCKR